jgi:hypothetical protein
MAPEKQSSSSVPALIRRLIGWFSSASPAQDNTAPIPTVQQDHVVLGESFSITFDAARSAIAIRVQPHVPPAHALAALQLPPYAGVIVVHGGAAQMEENHLEATRRFWIEAVCPLAQTYHLLVIDGGTHSGTAHILGETRAAINGTFPLVGVVPECCISYPGSPAKIEDAIALDASHSHFILVQGERFSDESALLVGLLQAAGRPGAALVINGGDIVYDEVKLHAAQRNPIITLEGSGRVADQLAQPASQERRQLPATTYVHVAHTDDPSAGDALIRRILGLPLTP